MIEIRERRITIDGEPRLVVAGEIHYFRLQPEEWEDRILKLVRAGGNAVASYIPWLCHELPSGEIDLDGHTRPALDLGRFIDLCQQHGLWFIARPGPFVMAELKNEGIPYRLYDQYPGIVPVTWDGKPVPTRTLDYTAPDFLRECRTWYSHVIPPIAGRLIQRGGNVIGLQLDNEVGMLSWVSNSPDLTDHTIGEFLEWLVASIGRDAVTSTYQVDPDDGAAFASVVRSPAASVSGALMRDLGWFMRERFARYFAALRGYAEEFGIEGIPFLINIHGTDGGSAAPFPIGISQLYRSYTQSDGYLAGSDHYLGDLDGANAADLYLMNAFMEAVNLPNQPLASFEFEAGSGDYSQGMGGRNEPSAADFKLRLSIAQGNRLINYYLFTGGVNYRMDVTTGDGNDRISFTGERHGTAAPIDPEGRESYTLPRLARTNHMLRAFESTLAVSSEERDNLLMGFVPDAFMTESAYPGNPVMGDIGSALRRNRFGGPATVLARSLMHLGYRYGAVDLQAADPPASSVLVLGSTLHMAEEVQQRLVDWLHRGGRLLLHGEVPQLDMTGASCTILANALGLDVREMHWGSPHYFPSIEAGLWAAPRPELRVGWAQGFSPVEGRTLFRIYGTDQACGFDIPVGEGRAIVLAAEVPADLDLFERALGELGASPGLVHDHPLRGVVTTSTIAPSGARFIHLLNLDGVDKPLRLLDGGEPLFEESEITLRGKDALMLPIGVEVPGATIAWSTAEVLGFDDEGLTVRPGGPGAATLLRTANEIAADDAFDIVRREDGVRIVFRESGDDPVRIRWSPPSPAGPG